MARAGVSLPALQQLMGHAHIQTTLHYYVQWRVMRSCFAKCLPLNSFLFLYCA
jgi:site-specific recombinase XerD